MGKGFLSRGIGSTDMEVLRFSKFRNWPAFRQDWNVKILSGIIERKVVNWVLDHRTLNATYIFFFPLATSADRFYRIDRSQVSFLEPICEIEKSPNRQTLLVVHLIHFSNVNPKTFTNSRMILIAKGMLFKNLSSHVL